MRCRLTKDVQNSNAVEHDSSVFLMQLAEETLYSGITFHLILNLNHSKYKTSNLFHIAML